MARSLTLTLSCMFWSMLAMGMYSAWGDNSPLTLTFLVTCLCIMGMGGLVALSPRSQRKYNVTPMPTVESGKMPAEPDLLPGSPDVPFSVTLFPVYLLEKHRLPFSRWAPADLRVDPEDKELFQRAAWAYQLFVFSQCAQTRFSDKSVLSMRSEQMQALRQGRSPLGATFDVLCQAISDSVGELEHAGVSAVEMTSCLEYPLAADILEDDPGSRYHLNDVGSSTESAHPEHVARELAHCLAFARHQALTEFGRFFGSL